MITPKMNPAKRIKIIAPNTIIKAPMIADLCTVCSDSTRYLCWKGT